jgi:hypothetical protein
MNRAQLIRECDRIWHLLVAHGMLHRCIVCGKPGTDPHHWRYIRSILQYRWSLENGVYMCRLCHNGVEQRIVLAKLYEIIKEHFPQLWAWGDSRPPLKSEPVRTSGIEETLARLKNTASKLGINYDR